MALGSFARAYVEIRADFDRYREDLRRAREETGEAADDMESEFNNLARTIASRVGIAAAIGGIAIGLRAIADAGEKMRKLVGQFTAITGSADRAAAAVESIREIASKTGDTIDTVGQLVTRFTLAAEEMGQSDENVSRFTENLLKLGRIGGASSEAIANGTFQLSQALAGGIVRAEEFNSLMENTPFIAKSIAESLGISLGELREMVNEGELLSGTVFEGILSQTDKINTKFDAMAQTRDQAWNRIVSAATLVGSEMDKILGVSNSWTRSLNAAASALEVVGQTFADANNASDERIRFRAQSYIEQQMNRIDERMASAQAALDRLGSDPSAHARRANPERQLNELMAERVELARKLLQYTDDTPSGGPRRGGRRGERDPTEGEFPTPDKDPLALAGNYALYGEGRLPTEERKATKRSTREPRTSFNASEVDSAVENIMAMTQAVVDQKGAINLADAELARYNATIQANNVFQEAMTTATDEERLTIEELKLVYIQTTMEVDRMTRAKLEQAKSSDEAKRAQDELNRSLSQTVSSMISGIQTADSFSEALKNVALSLLEVVLKGALLNEGPASGLGSILGQVTGMLVGGFMGGGANSGMSVANQYASYGAGKLPMARARGGPVNAGVPYLVNENTARSELFVPSGSGAVLNVAQAQAALANSGGQGGEAAFAPQFHFAINQAIPGVESQIQTALGKAMSGPQFKVAIDRFRGRRS